MIFYNGFEDQAVLIMDDNESVASLLSEVFTRFGAEPTKVLSGQDALKELKARNFDIVLLDVRMDSVDGWDVLAELGTSQPALLKRTIIMTGDGFRFETARRIKEFNLPTLYKPFDLNVLKELARKALGIAPTASRSAA